MRLSGRTILVLEGSKLIRNASEKVQEKMNKLNTGNEMPSVIVSTQKVYRDDAAPYTKAAIEAGHRHIDTAWIYGNEAEVGQGIKESGVERSQLFITSRIWALPARPESVSSNLDRTLENLKMEHVDLCLMHWPLPGGCVDTHHLFFTHFCL